MFTKCKVQRCDQDESELTLLFEVIDTGTGFDANEESVMFKPFSQVDSSVNIHISCFYMRRLSIVL